MNEELKPCPFCGEEAKVYVKKIGFYWIFCENCGARTDYFLNIEQAIKAWNNRQQESKDAKETQ